MALGSSAPALPLLPQLLLFPRRSRPQLLDHRNRDRIENGVRALRMEAVIVSEN